MTSHSRILRNTLIVAIALGGLFVPSLPDQMQAFSITGEWTGDYD